MWTNEQQKAIDLRGKSLIVSAAAGSGKTAVLVERVKKLIIEDGVPVSRMLIVTFTNAAASEMRRKILKAIEDELKKGGENEAFLREQLDELPNANISTFHSFALNVIRRDFHLIDVDPGFSVCDETRAALLSEDAMDECFEDFFEEMSPEFTAMMDRHAGAKSFQNVRDMIKTLYDAMMNKPEPEAWISEKTEFLRNEDELGKFFEEKLKFELKDGLSRAHLKLKAAMERLENYGLSGMALKLLPEVERTKEAYLAASGVATCSELRQYILSLEFATLRAGKDEKALYEDIKDEVKELRDTGKGIIKGLKDELLYISIEDAVKESAATYEDVKILSDMARCFAKHYGEKKAELKLLDFNDIEHLALEILKHEEIQEEYRSMFDYVFVDEYQDTNFIQDCIVESVSRKDNKFLVGDLKQCIYHFRLAEPTIFKEHYAEYKTAPAAEAIDLNANFRCSLPIVDAVNLVSLPIMEGYESNMLIHGRDVATETPRESDMYILECSSEQEDEEIAELKDAQKEALLVSKLVKEELRRGTRPRDIVILMRSVASSAEAWSEIFSAAGIPLFIDESEGFFDTLEIEVFMNLLKVTDNRDRDVAFISALHSPAFSFSIEDLANVRIEGGKEGSFFEAFLRVSEGVTGLSARCQKVLDRIEEWTALSRELRLDDFCAYLMEQNGFFAYFGALPGGERRIANLKALIDKAQSFMGERTGGLYAFISYVDALRKRNVKIPQVRMAGEGDDVVRIMTIHKSKGLEFPVVFLSGLGKRMQTKEKNAAIYVHSMDGIALRSANAEKRSYKRTFYQKLMRRNKLREQMEEETRILYVAMTRARDKLVLTGTVKDYAKASARFSAASYGDVLSAGTFLELSAAPFVSGLAGKLNLSSSAALSLTGGEESAALGREEFERRLRETLSEPADEKIYAEIERRFSYRYESEAGNKHAKYSVTELNELNSEKDAGLELRPTEPSEGNEGAPPYFGDVNKQERVPIFMREISEEEELSAARRGTAMHTAFEHLHEIFPKEGGAEALPDSEELEGFVQGLFERGILSETEAKSIRQDKLRAFCASELGKRMAAASVVYREQPFSLMTDYEGERVFVQGIIDAFFIEGDGKAVLLDYKTNSMRQGESREAFFERMKDTYALQISIYSEAIEKIKKLPVKEAYLYLSSIDCPLRIK